MLFYLGLVILVNARDAILELGEIARYPIYIL